MTETGGAPANWYPDPTGRFEYRYWDGALWTEDVATAGQQSRDPLTPPAPPVDPTPTPTAPAAPSAPPPGGEVERPEHLGAIARFRKERQDKIEDRVEFETLAMKAAKGDSEALDALPNALGEAQRLWKPSKFEDKRWEVMAVATQQVIADDIMTADEEEHLYKLSAALGTPVDQMAQKNFALFEEFVIAGINDGRLPKLEHPPIMIKGNETAYASFGVALMKEVTLREFRGGSNSISVPLGGGFRYRVGGMRGKSVVVGTQLVAQDTGILVVTSIRSVFVGQKKTLEFRNDKLLGLEQYADGLRLNVSSRQAASLFTMAVGQSPSIAAALIQASCSAPSA